MGKGRPKPSILIVDDEVDVSQSIQDLLRRDFDVTCASSASEGLALLADIPVQVVMTDQRMPEMSGVEFLEICRERHPDVVRLLFTGYADIGAVIDAINAGQVYRYINKPWEPEELPLIIREAVDRYELLYERKSLLSELQRKNEELELEKELRGEFIKVASHELQTPLAILIGVTDLAKRALGDKGPSASWLDRIDAAGGRLKILVDELIAMMSAGRFDTRLNREETSVGGLFEEVAHDIRPFVELRHQSLEVSSPDDVGPLSIDRKKIVDTLEHLLLNAIKFTPDGGRIRLNASQDHAGVAIDVIDDGDGIPPEVRGRLFEPFYTGRDSSTHSSGRFEYRTRGLGLGLSVARAFVEMHDGAIDIQSEVGKGTRVRIVLP